jgi:hypothetical protein
MALGTGGEGEDLQYRSGAEKERKEGDRDIIPFRDRLPETFFHPNLTFYHLSVKNPLSESINGLIH